MMHMSHLLQNFTNIIVFIILANRIYPYINRWNKPGKNIMIGVLFGIAGLITLLWSTQLESEGVGIAGISIELKSVIAGMSGMLGGPVSAVVTTLIIGVYRWSIGGIGVLSGMISVVAVSLVGALLHVLYKNKDIAYRRIWWVPVLFGIFIAAVQLATTVFFKPEIQALIIRNYTIPFFIVFPITALVFHYFMTVEWARQNDTVFDRTTKLPRYNWIESKLKRLLKKRLPFSMVIFHIERLRAVTDMHGTLSSSVVLRECAGRLAGSLPPGATLSRLNGEGFVVSLPSFNMLQTLIWVVDVKKKLSDSYSIVDNSVFLTFSSGLAVYDGTDTTLEELFLQADTALRHAMDKGLNQTVPYESRLTEQSRYRIALEKDLRFALERGQFRLQYQPQYELESGRLRGFEALLRWHHPDWGAVSPSEFIPLAEESGLIIPIGEWVLRTSCEMAKKLNVNRNGVTMAVNISAVQLLEPGFPDTVSAILRSTGLNSERLELELTETTLVQSFEKAGEELLRLKALGVRLALDDFGVGYSSLSYLRRLPFDLIKIDRSFIEDVGRGREDKMIQSMIDWIHELRYGIVAEGLESYEQLHWLKQWKCDIGQGYIFSRPMSEEDVLRYLRQLVPFPIVGPSTDANGVSS